MDSSHDVTRLLIEWSEGEQQALEQLAPLIYAELRRVAANHMRGEKPGDSLQPTALVHEAYLRMVNQNNVRWQNRAHFLGIASQMMRRILVDRARARAAAKRGAGGVKVSISVAERSARVQDYDVVALDDALKGLEALDPRMGRIVELRFYGGLKVEEIAAVLGISRSTVEREWSTARAFLRRELAAQEKPGKA